MKIVYISDTHNKHHQVSIPSGDLIIHAGDVTAKGTLSEVESFLNWFEKLDFTYKIFIPGNHDFFFERAREIDIKKMIPSNVIYLNDEGIEIDSIKIWGSPVQPRFYDWAFNRDRGADIKRHWDLIPLDTDVLITHGPPFGILDLTTSGSHVGCEDLLDRIRLVKPKIHVFGHIHEAYGTEQHQSTRHINASVLNASYQNVNAPIVIEWS